MNNLKDLRSSIKQNVIYKKYNLDSIKKFNDEKFQNFDENQLQINMNKLNYVISTLVKNVDEGFINKKHFLQETTQEINDVLDSKLSEKEVATIIKYLIKNKDSVQRFILPNNIDQEGGFLGKIFGWDYTTSGMTKIADMIDMGLDLVGIVPGIGIVVDAAGLVFSLMRGKMLDAFFSGINIIPVVGSFIGVPGKYITKMIRYGKKANKMRGRYDKFSGMASSASSFVPRGRPYPPPPPPQYNYPQQYPNYNQGYGQGYEQGYGQDYGQGYGQGYDQGY